MAPVYGYAAFTISIVLVSQEIFHPTTLSILRLLKLFKLFGNNISSELPNSFFNVTEDISDVDLGYNNFYGRLPIALSELPKLSYLLLNNNKLEGSMPSFAGNLSSLVSFDMSYIQSLEWQSSGSPRSTP
ncbi:LRR receptor kinase SERK2-like [Prosopis cineraria]|uniref:LRR receptor kinase SERK2-like n=1 Tax=Prosopis cineraria TaxID=364024 RepID=UPI00241021EF|nr:LRR receptor kinase SERK2-like [Prosopis cineraria]XP_054817582.1 LRR receptor kinase SERK2-like [Prosopis cineraria]